MSCASKEQFQTLVSFFESPAEKFRWLSPSTQKKMKQAAQRTLAQAVRSTRPSSLPSYRPRPSTSSTRPFSSTRFHLQQTQQESKSDSQKEGEQPKDDSKQKKQQPEENDTTVAGRSPFAAFVEVLREEVRKNREWQDSVKQLGGEVSKVQDSEAMKRAKEAYERARVNSITFSLP